MKFLLFLLFFSYSVLSTSQNNPTLISPSDNIVLHDQVTTFTWNTHFSYNSQEIQISTDSLFTNIFLTDSSLFFPKFICSSLNKDTYYYWRVRGKNNDGYSLWSDFNQFIIASPSSLDNLQFWMDATKISDLNDGDSLSIYYELSPRSDSLDQLNTLKQPTFKKNIINNQSSFYFDGSDALEGSDILDRNGPFSFFAVGKLNSPLNYCTVFSKSVGIDGGFYLGANSTTDKIRIYADDLFVYDNTTRYGNDFFVVSFNAKSDSVYSYFNNTKYYSALNTSDLIGDNIFNFVVGAANFSQTYNWNGYISEIIINNSALSDSLIHLYNQYLMDKYAPPINLGADTSSCNPSVIIDAYNNCYKNYLWQDNSVDSIYTITSSGYYSLQVTDVFGRQSIDSIYVNLDTTPFAVDIISDTTLCFGEQLYINSGPSHLSYLWSTGDTTSYKIINTSGIYFVTVTDCMNNVTTDSIVATFNDYSYTFNIDSTLCYYDTLVLNPNFSTSLTYSWSNGFSTSSINVSTPGNYSVTISDSLGCVYQSDTANISIDHYPQLVSLGDDDTLCAGINFHLLTGENETTNYLWSSGETTDHIVVNAAGEYSVTTTNELGCVARDTINIQIKGYAPLPGFFNDNQCMGDLTSFTDTSQSMDLSNIIAWEWDFGNGNISSLQNPNFTFPDTGNFTVNLKVITDSTCENSISKTLRIYTLPEAQFSNNELCQNYLINFINTSTSEMGSIDYVRWDFGNADTTHEISTQRIFEFDGNYPVQLIVETSNGCRHVLDTSIQIKPSPIANFSFDAICKNETSYFYDESEFTGVNTIYNYYWECSSGVSSTTPHPSFVFNQNEPLSMFLKVRSINGCTDTISKTFYVYDKPIAEFLIDTACLGKPVVVENNSSDSQANIQMNTWWLDGQLIDMNAIPNLTVSTDGNHSLLLKVISETGCSDTLSKGFEVHPLPHAGFDVSEDYTTPNQNVILIADSISDENTYTFIFGDGWNQNTAIASHAFVDAGIYESELIVQSAYRCLDSTFKTITIVLPQVDLEISQLETYDDQGKTKIRVLLSNIGNLDIHNISLRIELNDQMVFEETYAETIPYGESSYYELKSQFLFDSEKPHYLCLTANVNSFYTDVNLSNNTECITKNIDDRLLKLYPNPVHQNLTLVYQSLEDVNLNYEIVNELGQEIRTGQLSILEKTHQYTISTAHLAPGVYVLKIGSDYRSFVKE